MVTSATIMGSKTAPDAAGVTCPVLATAQIVSGKWTLVMLRDLAEGPRRFSELQRSLAASAPGRSPSACAPSNARGSWSGGVRRDAARVEYRLTPKGAALAPIVDAMRAYGPVARR